MKAWISSGMLILMVGAAGATGLGKVVQAPQLAAQVRLGKLLFFEPALSVNGKRSCASCHRPEKAFTDHRGTSRALRFTSNLTRNAPTVLNAAAQTSFFHDGRARSLDEVIAAVLTSPDEMGSSYALAAERLGSSPGYRQQFRRAFGRQAIAEPTINAALAAYLRSLTATRSPYDQALAGGAPLPAAAAVGAGVFVGAGRCANCHSGSQLRDGRRHEVAPGQWLKTPTLRNVAATMPYGADGRYATLPAVLNSDFHRAQLARPLMPTELNYLTAFLETLTDTTSADHTAPASLPALPALPNRAIGGSY